MLTERRLSYAVLCAAPFVAAGCAAVRAWRVPGVHQAVGAAICASMLVAAWRLAGPALRGGDDQRRVVALAGACLLAPFALVALLWVGLATPWDATPAENQMRYQVLAAASVLVAVGFVCLHRALVDAGDRLLAAPAVALAVLGGAGYLVWTTFQAGLWLVRTHTGDTPASLATMNQVFDATLFFASVLAYATTMLFVVSLGRVRWMRRGAAGAYLALNAVALAFLVARGVVFPNPNAGAAPWYVTPGFIAGIPAMPWLMPALIGAWLLARSGTDRR